MPRAKRIYTAKQRSIPKTNGRTRVAVEASTTGFGLTLTPDLYLNRELSWLDFNERVLAESADPVVPLIERAKFEAIFSSNMDEFFMIRVAGVKRKIASGIAEPGPDGRTPAEQYQVIRERVLQLSDMSSRLYLEEIAPLLAKSGVDITTYAQLSKRQQKAATAVFDRDVFPVLTPQAVDRARPFPHVSNESLNLIVLLQGPTAERHARIKVPAVIPRLIRIPASKSGESEDSNATFIWLEDLISVHLDRLFPGHVSAAAYAFHVTRDSDIEIDEDDEEAHDLLVVMREMLSERTFGSIVRIVVGSDMPPEVATWLLQQIGATNDELYVSEAPLALEDLMELLSLDRPDLKDPPFVPAPLARAPALDNSETNSWGTPDIFGLLRQQDVMAHLPYETFNIVADFLRAAASDPDVVAIKQTLYRIGKDSPLIPALIDARDDDTQVAVLVEVKARFDEENNITWAKQLENHGVHVAYGVAGLKTHCKLTLVVRREANGLRRYVHLATGNYNAATARVYEDLGVFTSREDLTHDVSELFNVLTGYSEQRDYRKLWVAPHSLRKNFLDAIHREIAAHKQSGNGRLIFKMNSLVDREIMRALYTASQAGISIDLIIRGACCLVPGVPGFSDNIRIRSVVGRFLEHSRIFSFGAINELYLGSADMMERNFDRRVEVVFPVEDPVIRDHISDLILPTYLADNVNAWTLGQTGQWQPPKAKGNEPLVDVQGDLLQWYASGGVFGKPRGPVDALVAAGAEPRLV